MVASVMQQTPVWMQMFQPATTTPSAYGSSTTNAFGDPASRNPMQQLMMLMFIFQILQQMLPMLGGDTAANGTAGAGTLDPTGALGSTQPTSPTTAATNPLADPLGWGTTPSAGYADNGPVGATTAGSDLFGTGADTSSLFGDTGDTADTTGLFGDNSTTGANGSNSPMDSIMQLLMLLMQLMQMMGMGPSMGEDGSGAGSGSGSGGGGSGGGGGGGNGGRGPGGSGGTGGAVGAGGTGHRGPGAHGAGRSDPTRHAEQMPKPTGEVQVDKTIVVKAGETFDGKGQRFKAGPSLGDGGQGESQKPVFILEDGATLKNVQVEGADGVHTNGDATLDEVWWSDVGEDAMTMKGEGDVVVNGGGAFDASDKIFQLNAGGSLTVNGFYADTFGKAVRTNGGKQIDTDITINNSTFLNGDESIARTDSRTATITFNNVETDGHERQTVRSPYMENVYGDVSSLGSTGTGLGTGDGTTSDPDLYASTAYDPTSLLNSNSGSSDWNLSGLYDDEEENPDDENVM